MTTKISIFLLASWALVFGVEYLGAKLVNLPGAHGSPLQTQQSTTQQQQQQKAQLQQQQLNNLQQQFPIHNNVETLSKSDLASNGDKHYYGEVIPAGAASSLATSNKEHRLRTRQAPYDPDYDEAQSNLAAIGAIGCKFSKTLCDSKMEWCFNDYAFGRCLKIYEPPEPSQLFRYELSKEDTHSLEREMERLYSLGYRWGHAYTQCILQNSLDAVRLGEKWDVSMCSSSADSDLEGAMNAFQDEVDPENLAFVKFTPSQSDPHPDFADELYRPPSEPIETSAVSSAVYEKLSSPVKSYAPAPGTGAGKTSSIKLKLEEETKPVGKSNVKSQLKALPPRQELNSLPEGLEEEMIEEAIAEYVARTGQKHKWNNAEKRAYPYYTSHREPISFADENGDGVDDRAAAAVELNNAAAAAAAQDELEEEKKRAVDAAEKELEEELEAEILFRVLAQVAAAAAGEGGERGPSYSIPQAGDVGVGNVWEESPQEPHVVEDVAEDTQILDEEALTQPRIFSPVYNTPNLFRHGLETKDTESAMFAAALEDAAAEELEEQQQEREREVAEEIKQRMIEEGAVEELPLALPLVGDNNGIWEEQQDIRPVYRLPADPSNYNNQDELILDTTGFSNNNNNDNNNNNIGMSREPQALEGDKPLYTEGGVVYLNNNPKRRFIVDFDPRVNSNGRRSSGFERHERLDVKKPGPWYRTVNNFGFDYDNKIVNPEFADTEGPADMLSSGSDYSEEAPVRSNSGISSPGNQEEEKEEERDVTEDEEDAAKANKKSAPAFMGSALPGSNSIGEHVEVIDTSQVNVIVEESVNYSEANDFRNAVADSLEIRPSALNALTFNGSKINFRVEPNEKGLNASQVAGQIASKSLRSKIASDIGIHVVSAEAVRRPTEGPFVGLLAADYTHRYLFMTFFLALLVVSLIVGALTLFLIRRQARQHEKLARLSQDDAGVESCKDYQDLCRARMASKNNEKVEPIKAVQRVASTLSRGSEDGNTSSRSSTSSWSEEPVLTNMDISTGHMVLSYMEDHLKNKDRLEQEWSALCGYEADPCCTAIAEKPDNMKKNRFTNSLPYDHSRVILNDLANFTSSDYINASTITDHDPRNPAYIATQGPMENTSADFWQMVWEQGSVVIVTLTRLADNGTPLCHRYWPEEGSELHHIYEVHLVSEHIWCDEYLVRSFYLKNLKTGETRTVTQFHFLAWPENNIPASTKALLEFRRDGAGRTGTYCLIDMVLNRMAKGAKEIDIAASLEHIRDQRPGMVRTKQQFEFVLMAVAEEVHAILKALPQ